MKEGERALFPDAVTERGKKHLKTLVRLRKSGIRAVMLYVVQRMDVRVFAPAREIDPAYADTLVSAVNQGVEIMVAQADVRPEGITFHGMLPFEL
jgi:sugar fermentation stimulation protein A